MRWLLGNGGERRGWYEVGVCKMGLMNNVNTYYEKSVLQGYFRLFNFPSNWLVGHGPV